MPSLSDEQLNKIFSVAIRPKELNEKNTIMKLFRVFRNKKKQENVKPENPSPATILFANTRQELPRKSETIAERPAPKTGLQNLSLKPINQSKSIDKNKPWMRQPLRPNTKSRPNPQQTRGHARNYLDLTL